MSEAEDSSVSVSETPMSSSSDGDKDAAIIAEWKQVCLENGIDPETHCLPDGRKVNVGYLVVCKKLGHPYPSFEPTVVVPEEVLPAVDPGAFCKPRTPDKPKGATSVFGKFELPPVPDLGAFKKAVTPSGLPPHVMQIADDNSRWGPPERDKPHPIQLAREHKAASEPPSASETPLLAFKPKASRPGFRGAQQPQASQSPKPEREWEDFIRRITREEIGRVDGRCSPSDKRTVDLVQREFQRLAEARALQDANTERDREVALELQRSEQRLAAVHFQRLKFALAVFVGFMLVLYFAA